MECAPGLGRTGHWEETAPDSEGPGPSVSLSPVFPHGPPPQKKIMFCELKQIVLPLGGGEWGEESETH